MQPKITGKAHRSLIRTLPKPTGCGCAPRPFLTRRPLCPPTGAGKKGGKPAAPNAKPTFKERIALTQKERTHVTRKRKQSRSLYADLFTEQELAALERTADNPLLQDEIGLLRMLIRRLAGQMLTAEDDERAPADKIKAVKDLTDILLNALKARHQLSPRAEDNLTEAMRQVVAEIEAQEQKEEKAQEHHHAE